jgi:hypothetical protein
MAPPVVFVALLCLCIIVIGFWLVFDPDVGGKEQRPAVIEVYFDEITLHKYLVWGDQKIDVRVEPPEYTYIATEVYDVPEYLKPERLD